MEPDVEPTVELTETQIDLLLKLGPLTMALNPFRGDGPWYGLGNRWILQACRAISPSRRAFYSPQPRLYPDSSSGDLDNWDDADTSLQTEHSQTAPSSNWRIPDYSVYYVDVSTARLVELGEGPLTSSILLERWPIMIPLIVEMKPHFPNRARRFFRPEDLPDVSPLQLEERDEENKIAASVTIAISYEQVGEQVRISIAIFQVKRTD